MGRVVDPDLDRTDEGEGERDTACEVVDRDDDESSGRGKKNFKGFQ